jgi:hypothetical protein
MRGLKQYYEAAPQVHPEGWPEMLLLALFGCYLAYLSQQDSAAVVAATSA